MILSLALMSTTWTLVAGGDIMLNRVSLKVAPFYGIADWTRKADVATANLEIPLTNLRARTSRKTAAELKKKTQFVLQADPGHVRSLSGAGFDVFGLGNNHAMDFGAAGLGQMRTALNKAGIGWCGAGDEEGQAAAARTVSVAKGFKVAFVSFLAFKSASALWKCTPAGKDSAGVATLSFGAVLGAPQMKRLKTIVRTARQGVDMVVVWLHWGTERKTLPDPWQVKLGRAFVEAGADCVLGAHPHVLQGAELYAGKPVFYSLGNLVSPLPGNTGLFRLSFEDRRLKRVEMLPCSIADGKVAALPLKARPAAVKAFLKLGAAMRAKYRHAKSQPLPLG